jgi:hypothetical protein
MAETHHFEGTLNIFIEKCEKLINEDTFGLSDPYTVVTVSNNNKEIFKGRTHTIDDNLNPKWRVWFTKRIVGDGKLKLELEVFDEDVGDPDFLGLLVYEFDPKTQPDSYYTVQLTDKKGGTKQNRGTITFGVWFADEQAAQIRANEDGTEIPGASSNILLGPVLIFREAKSVELTYAVDVIALTDSGEQPSFTVKPKPTEDIVAKEVFNFEGKHLWRFTTVMARSEHKVIVHYSVSNKSHQFIIPGVGEPLRALSTSCNGFHEPPTEKLKNPPYYMWSHALKRHHNTVGGYHLIIQGGDQVYADPLWHKIPYLEGLEAGAEAGAKKEVTPEFRLDIERFYMDLYIESWKDPDLRQAYASIPSIMMWDDHDIFDGWGSYPEDLMTSPLYQTIGGMAEKYFCAFQLGATVDEVKNQSLKSSLRGKTTGYSQMYRIDSTGIASLDLRKERQMKRVCTSETYDDFSRWLKENQENMDHLYLVLSIPIVYNDFDVLEKAISATGLGAELKDDLQDHWRTEDHREERLKLLKLLLDAAHEGKFRITILSGDVHISCAGVIYDKIRSKKSNATIINSLISSAVVNVAPPQAVIQILELTGAEIETVERTENTWIKAGLYRLLGDTRQFRYFGGRAYLELIQNYRHGICARWFVENHENEPFELYIFPFTELGTHTRHNIQTVIDKITKDGKLRVDDFKFISNSITTLLTLPFQTISSWFE